MGEPIVLLTDRDPLLGAGGGPSYVRAHARAMLALGLEPQIFYISTDAGAVETDFGVCHRVPSPLRRHPRWTHPWDRDIQAPILLPRLNAAVRDFLIQTPSAMMFHSFGYTGSVAIDVSARLRSSGRTFLQVNSAFTTRRHEAEGRLRLVGGYSLPTLVRHRLMHLWTRLMVDRYERRAYMGSDLILVNYESVRRILIDTYSCLPEIRNIPYTSDSAFLQMPTEVLPREIGELCSGPLPLLVSVSRHDSRKGLDVFIRALEILERRGTDFRACLVGPGELMGAHARLIADLSLESKVTIAGQVADPRQYLRRADVYVLPSVEEASGSLALLEAMELGVAPVVSNLDGLPEDIVDDENGLLVPPADPSALADALERLIGQPELRLRLGAQAQRTFRERFSTEAMTAALARVYSDLGFPLAREHS